QPCLVNPEVFQQWLGESDPNLTAGIVPIGKYYRAEVVRVRNIPAKIVNQAPRQRAAYAGTETVFLIRRSGNMYGVLKIRPGVVVLVLAGKIEGRIVTAVG